VIGALGDGEVGEERLAVLPLLDDLAMLGPLAAG